jgi:hypothetical protein
MGINQTLLKEQNHFSPASRYLFLLIIGLFLFAVLTNLAFAHGMSEEEKKGIIDG